ncbi:MAG TPA: DUF456 domain-containing protein [Gemmatimonadaceae bacterium]|jgi:Uncharacterized protein conserved in bacteria
MAPLFLGLALVAGLILIPFGLPGLWVMVGAVLAYSYMVPAGAIGTWTVVVAAGLAAVGEVLEFLLAGQYARRYGGSRRAGWGAIIGSIVGAVMGVPIPLLGSLIGAFVGAFAGALLAELTHSRGVSAATRVATGALLGRIVAVAVKAGIGCAILVWVAFALWLGR